MENTTCTISELFSGEYLDTLEFDEFIDAADMMEHVTRWASDNGRDVDDLEFIVD